MGREWCLIHKLRPAAISGKVVLGSRMCPWIGTGKHMIAQAGLGENKAKPLSGTGLGSRDQGENPASGAEAH